MLFSSKVTRLSATACLLAAAACAGTIGLATAQTRGGKRGAAAGAANKGAPAAPRRAVYIPYADARPVLEAVAEVLPPELRDKEPLAAARDWPGWAARRDAEIRARLAQGDEDTLVNLLLFGTTFTRQPRVTQQQLGQISRQSDSSTAAVSAPELARLVEGLRTRADDLVRAALNPPAANDRLLFARSLLVGHKKFPLETAEGRERAKSYLLSKVVDVLGEFGNYGRILEAARAQSPTEEFVARSRLFRDRGLSSDTTLPPNFAIEEALKSVAARGLLAPGSVRRVAVIGPGLDFTDKQEGFDFYPPQSIQPFAVIDSLLRLGLAPRASDIQVTTFDLSPRVNDHVARARERALSGRPYVLQLPYDAQHAPWRPEVVRFWEQFGDRIGASVAPLPVPPGAGGGVRLRAVSVRPNVAALVTPVDLNVVLQRLELPPAERFDLIVATNILVYYDVFEQSLAVANIERMLRPGGFLLSNNALVELPFARLRAVDYTTAVYSERAGDGDHVVWYQRAAD